MAYPSCLRPAKVGSACPEFLPRKEVKGWDDPSEFLNLDASFACWSALRLRPPCWLPGKEVIGCDAKDPSDVRDEDGRDEDPSEGRDEEIEDPWLSPRKEDPSGRRDDDEDPTDTRPWPFA